MTPTQFEILPLAARNLGANGGAANVVFRAPIGAPLTLALVVTALSGTTPSLDAWLLAVMGGRPVDVPYDLHVKSAATVADVAADVNKRNLSGTAAIIAAESHIAIYRTVPGAVLQFHYEIAGTVTPTVTFGVWGACGAGPVAVGA